MRRFFGAVSVVLACAAGTATVAQERPYTRALTCAAVKDIVAREQNIVLATSASAYEMVHRNSMACTSDETGAPAFEPTSDEMHCLAGWRCQQRSTNGSDR